jgi:hypothetical protein
VNRQPAARLGTNMKLEVRPDRGIAGLRPLVMMLSAVAFLELQRAVF